MNWINSATYKQYFMRAQAVLFCSSVVTVRKVLYSFMVLCSMALPVIAQDMRKQESPVLQNLSPLQQKFQTYVEAARQISVSLSNDDDRSKKIAVFDRQWLNEFVEVLALAPKDDPWRVRMLIEMGAIFSTLGDPAASIRVYEQAQKSNPTTAEKRQCLMFKAELARQIALSNLDDVSKVQTASEYLEDAVSQLNNLNDPESLELVPELLLDYAIFDRRLGHLDKAAELAMDASKLLKVKSAKSRKVGYNLEDALLMVATIAAKQGIEATMYGALNGLALVDDKRYDMGYYVSECVDLIDSERVQMLDGLIKYGLDNTRVTAWITLFKINLADRQMANKKYAVALATMSEIDLNPDTFIGARPKIANPAATLNGVYTMMQICLDELGDHASAGAIGDLRKKIEQKLILRNIDHK